jgi:hypothetical protein
MALALVLGLCAAGGSGHAAAPVSPASGFPPPGLPDRGYPCQAAVQPVFARLGQPVVYRGRVVVSRLVAFRWEPPSASGAFEWGSPRTRRIPVFVGSKIRTIEKVLPDTMQVEIPLQVFALGNVTVPGLGFQVRGSDGAWRRGQLPIVSLAVAPVVPPADTSVALRPLRGPLRAPWWERVPWRIVLCAALALAVGVIVVRRLRRRKTVQVSVAVRPAKDPAVEALEALEALRGLHLPGQGRFAEHAFHLTRILRRFLEVTQGVPRPGDSTPELLSHLESARLEPADLTRLAALLAAWDRVKFARAASSLEEARRAEEAVEELARRRLTVPGKEAA